MGKDNHAASAVAHSNIALVKYWGKKDPDLNLPVTGSISFTLDKLFTKTYVTFNESLKQDTLFINDKLADDHKKVRLSKFLDIIRKTGGIKSNAEIHSTNSFPIGAGLASSASAFAALALAASRAAGLTLSKGQLSALARQGSGSAARSIYGGFVEMLPGQKPDGSDAHARQLAPLGFWDLRLLIAITSTDEKEIGSTAGMKRTAQTSPYYAGWVCSTPHDLEDMRTAIKNKDIQKVGELAEHSCLKMHALMMSARPSLIYWNDTTMRLIHEVKNLRHEGVQVYFTIDAGPQVKVICNPDDVGSVSEYLADIHGVTEIIHNSLGPDAYLEE
jgi:diphosphomevalonate decarboxylase